MDIWKDHSDWLNSNPKSTLLPPSKRIFFFFSNFCNILRTNTDNTFIEYNHTYMYSGTTTMYSLESTFAKHERASCKSYRHIVRTLSKTHDEIWNSKRSEILSDQSEIEATQDAFAYFILTLITLERLWNLPIFPA